MRMGTQQQYNNQDRYLNEFVPPRPWTLLCSVWSINLKNLRIDYSFLYLLSLIMCERVGKNNRPFSHCFCACVFRSRGALFPDNRRDFTQMGQTDFKSLILSM